MSVITYPSGLQGPLPPAPPRRFTVAEFHRLIETGAFSTDERSELIEGWIIPKMSRSPPHDVCIDLAQDILRPLLPSGWRLRIQSAITLDESEPEPDFAFVEGPASRYVRSHPTPSEIDSLIEVADTTLNYDRKVKGRVYAQAKIPRYWIINLIDRQIEVDSVRSVTAQTPITAISRCLGNTTAYRW